METSVLEKFEISAQEIGKSKPRKFNKRTSQKVALLVGLCCLQMMTGCATTSFPVMGIRPDHPNFVPSQDVLDWCGSSKDTPKMACEMYRNYHEYAVTLSASYRSRATLNEWGLYFAGLIGLSGLTATAGLAATNAGIQALRIVPLVSGFVSGTTAVLENRDKALNYTKAANAIDEAVDEANRMVVSGQMYAEAFDILSQKVTKAKNDLESTRVELAARDKQIDEIVKRIKENLPKPLGLSEENIDIPLGTSHSVKVEDGASIDPTRTTTSKAGVVEIKYSANNQLITITGRKPGETAIKFRNKEGVSATVIVEVLEIKKLTATEATAGGTRAETLSEGQKIAYELPDGITGDGITSNAPEIAFGRLLEDRKWIVVEAVKKPQQPRTSEITVGLKDKNGVMKIIATVN